ncbi:hypothetical protein RP20_CCG015831 [Aedes albopictus]|nr:hypothetical protein RP20_CCG015831 [Aedes albopictus]
MIPDIFNIINKARYSGIIAGPKTAPSLYQLSVKAFVKGLDRKCKPETRIPKLQLLPAVALISILEEMSCYPSLRKKLHRELCDPVVFMRMFMRFKADRLVLERCLRKASSIGKPVLPELANNWCMMVNEKKSEASSSSVQEAMEFGTYLHEAGWALQSIDVFDIALRMISQLKGDQNQDTVKLICTQKLLRAEGSAMLISKADITCNTLLTMIEGIENNEILLTVFLEVANHHFKAKRIAETHDWTRKAMELMTESTPTEHVIEILQLESIYLYLSQRYESAGMIVNQAIHRARLTFGHLHRRYADTLYTYGVSLLKINAISDSTPVFLELLDIITKLYGTYTPHVAIIQSYLAYGFYRRSQATGRFDMAYDHIQSAITLAKQIIPERQKVINHFCGIRAMILRGHEDVWENVEENRAVRINNFYLFTISEIKHLCFELHDEIDA